MSLKSFRNLFAFPLFVSTGFSQKPDSDLSEELCRLMLCVVVCQLSVVMLVFYMFFQLFSCGSVASEISTDILKDLIYQLSMIMLDPRLEDIEEGTQVIRSVNILLVKVVEKSCLTNVVW